MSEVGRAELVARWLLLTREILPGMAVAAGWPIRWDHCFMRVFLDHAVGDRWDLVVRRPAVRFISLPMLERAVALAEGAVAQPGRLPGMNAQSLAWRAQRRGRAGVEGGTRGGA